MTSTILDAIPYSLITVPLVLVLIAGLARSSVKILREYERAVVFTLARIIHQGWRAWRNPLIGHRIRLRHLNSADFGAHARQA